MQITRETIAAIASKEKEVRKLVDKFREGKFTEDELISHVIDFLYKDMKYYRNESINNDSRTW